jgi:hypothetical protein
MRPYLKKENLHTKGLVEWLKCKTLNSNPVPINKKWTKWLRV